MPDRVDLRVTVNGTGHTLSIEPRETLADVVRDRLGLVGTKVSCDAQVCGACTVLVDGLAVSACTFLAIDADGTEVRTVEGLAPEGKLSRIQQAFIDHAAFQCGFCTPGMLMAATALLDEDPDPSREAVVEAMEGNLCRCTGYEPIVEAVLAAATVGGGGRDGTVRRDGRDGGGRDGTVRRDERDGGGRDGTVRRDGRDGGGRDGDGRDGTVGGGGRDRDDPGGLA